MKRRKLPNVGIFDPNQSGDPQYGKVSSLRSDLKRVHVHYENANQKFDNYQRLRIQFPECTKPTMTLDELKIIKKVRVPVIQNVEFDLNSFHPQNLKSAGDSVLCVGLFEASQLSRDLPPRYPATSHENKKLDAEDNIEGIFILNKPIIYWITAKDHTYSGDVGSAVPVSNIPEGGYVCLQNYLNLYIAYKNMDKNLFLSLNVYVDYKTCDVDYESAKVWKADFEEMICSDLKYKGICDGKNVLITSRGSFWIAESTDPEKFPEETQEQKDEMERELFDLSDSKSWFPWW